MVSSPRPRPARRAARSEKAVTPVFVAAPTPSVATSTSELARTLKILAAVGIVALLMWTAGQVLLLMFAGILLAVVLRAAAVKVAAKLDTSPGVGLACVVLGGLLLLTLLGLMVAPQVLREGQQLVNSLPLAWARVQAYITPLVDTAWLAQMQANMTVNESNSGLLRNLSSRMLGILSNTFGALGSVVVVLTTAIYLAADPATYRNGVLKLMPPPWRPRMAEVLEIVRTALVGWSVGMAVSMSVIALLTFVGLAVLGVPLALVLAVLAGLLNFIPNFGPILSGIPAVMLALGGGPNAALYVLLLYVAIQGFESYVLTPNIQQRTIALPPVLTLGAQILLGISSGVLGLLLATPLAAVVLVLVRELYVKDYLEGGQRGSATAVPAA